MAAFTSKRDFVLTIEDPENGIPHQLILSADDYIKAKQDETYANALLFHARCNANNLKTTSWQQADDSSEVNEDISSRSQQPENEPAVNNIKQVYTWSYDQTVNLINSMANHIEDLSHPKKRKDVFENIANDLISVGYEIDVTMAKNKWKSLVTSYKKAKDNKTRTGQGPSRFMFFDLMDDVLGTKPTNSCNHSINSSDVASVSTQNDAENEVKDTVELSVSESEAVEDNVEPKRVKRARESEKKLKYEYILTKQEEYSKRQKRHEEKVELERQQIEIEKRKLNVLEEYLNYLRTKDTPSS